jgi:hypothetical protein
MPALSTGWCAGFCRHTFTRPHKGSPAQRNAWAGFSAAPAGLLRDVMNEVRELTDTEVESVCGGVSDLGNTITKAVS